ncbi:hypothetical protein RJT34_15456 [Clitoria ternatea]|uniref:C2 domain-containing protein n=1 Tax=Clitoria ternatea TaxID=43366 RepID=A0AAN9J797_CLITE
METKSHNACTLEITVISGENIRVDQSSKVYVVVRAESLSCCTTKMVNKEEEGGDVLAWNEKFMLRVPSHAKSITFEVQCQKYKGVRPIGVARIALSDFVGGNIHNHTCLQMLSYGLRDSDGRRNGVIHFSVKVVTPTPNLDETMVTSNGLQLQLQNQVMGFRVGQKNPSHVVIGIPVWWSYNKLV